MSKIVDKNKDYELEKKKVKKLAKKMENHDTLITFGEEALTMRKDDPRTKEFKEDLEEKFKKNRKKLIANDEVSLFEGINLSNKRAEDESYEQYKDRLRSNKMLERIYQTLGRKEAKIQYPETFKQALIYALKLQEINNNKK